LKKIGSLEPYLNDTWFIEEKFASVELEATFKLGGL
jgi:hypothetical protein